MKVSNNPFLHILKPLKKWWKPSKEITATAFFTRENPLVIKEKGKTTNSFLVVLLFIAKW